MSNLQNVVAAHAEALRDIEGLMVSGEALDNGRFQIAAVITINGREYAHAVSVLDGDMAMDYAPLLRGWYEDLIERLARDDNRAKAD